MSPTRRITSQWLRHGFLCLLGTTVGLWLVAVTTGRWPDATYWLGLGGLALVGAAAVLAGWYAAEGSF